MKNELYQQIIDVATEMFLTYRYSKVSMDELAEKIGISKKTLYNVFENKEKILEASVENFIEKIQKEDNEILLNSQISFPNKVKQYLTLIGTKLSAVSPYFIADIIHSAPRIWLRVQEYKSEAIFIRFKTLLDDGEKNGFIKKNINKSLAILLYASAIESVLNPQFNRYIPDEMRRDLPYSAAGIFEGILKIIFEGIFVSNL